MLEYVKFGSHFVSDAATRGDLISFNLCGDIRDAHKGGLQGQGNCGPSAYGEARVIRELEVRQDVLDLHALKELVTADDTARDSLLLEGRLDDAGKGIVAYCELDEQQTNCATHGEWQNHHS